MIWTRNPLGTFFQLITNWIYAKIAIVDFTSVRVTSYMSEITFVCTWLLWKAMQIPLINLEQSAQKDAVTSLEKAIL